MRKCTYADKTMLAHILGCTPTHGGPRPNSGGPRKGAGRKPGPPTHPLHLRVPEATLGAFRAKWGDGTNRRVVELMTADVAPSSGRGRKQ